MDSRNAFDRSTTGCVPGFPVGSDAGEDEQSGTFFWYAHSQMTSDVEEKKTGNPGDRMPQCEASTAIACLIIGELIACSVLIAGLG